MEFTQHTGNGLFNITLTGSFTFNDHDKFRSILETIGQPGIQRVSFNMAQVEFVDSAALGMLMLARDEANKHERTLVISGATGQVKKMFELTRFERLFTLA